MHCAPLVMVVHHHSPDRALGLRTEITANGFAWPMPLLGIVLTTVGFLLFMAGLAGLMEMPVLATSMRPSWLHSQDGGDLATMTRSPTVRRWAGPHPRVLVWSDPENAGFGGRWLSRATSSSPTRGKQMVNARVAVDPFLGPGSAHVGTALVSPGSGIISADLQQPMRLARSCRRTPADSAHEAVLPPCRNARARQGEDISIAVYPAPARTVG
jgi:hypothetical protein